MSLSRAVRAARRLRVEIGGVADEMERAARAAGGVGPLLGGGQRSGGGTGGGGNASGGTGGPMRSSVVGSSGGGGGSTGRTSDSEAVRLLFKVWMAIEQQNDLQKRGLSGGLLRRISR